MAISSEDEFDSHNKMQTLTRFLLLFSSVVALNLFLLNVIVFKNFSIKTSQEINNNTSIPSRVLGTTTSACPQSCILKINETVNAAINPSNSATTSSPKEYFIPLGSGTAEGNDWTDVPGLQVQINTNNYPKIKSANFESSVYVPGANQIAYLRLYNITEDHPVWNSDLNFNNAGTAQTQSSQTIVLGSGNKAYKVQIKTQLQFATNVTGARIRIITQ